MDEHQGETDGEATELTIGMTTVGDAEDDHQEDEGQQSLNEEGTPHRSLEIATSYVSGAEELTITISGEGAEGHIGGFGDHHQQATGDDTTDDLSDPIAKHLFQGHTTVHPHTETHCRIQVSARNVTDAVGHSDDCETEGDSNTKESNMTKDCSTATTENKNERAEQFGEEFVTDFHNDNF